MITSCTRTLLHYTFLPVLVSFRILSICFCLNKKQQATNNIDGEEYESSDNLLGLQLKQMRDSIVKEIRIAGTPPSKTSSPRYRHDNVDNERQDPKDAILLLQAAKTVSWVEKVYFMQAIHLFAIGAFQVMHNINNNNMKFPQAFLNLTLWHQGLYAVAVLLTVAFRNDYPFNLTVVLFSMYYCGWIHGMKEACV